MSTSLSAEALKQFAHSVFLPLKNGECVSCMFTAGGGKRTIIKEILSEQNILKEIFANSYKKTLFVYVDPDEILELSNKAYLELLYICLKNVSDKKKVSTLEKKPDPKLSDIKDTLTEIVTAGWSVILILNDFEITLSLSPSIYLNLESLMSIDKSKIVYLFLSTVNLFDENVLRSLHNLKFAVSRKVRYFPLFNKNDANMMIEQISNKLNINITDKLNSLLFELCGGHPQLIKYSLHILAEKGNDHNFNTQKVQEFLLNHYQIKIVCADIWNFLSQKEKDVLKYIFTNGKLPLNNQDEIDYLSNLRLIKKMDDNNYRVFGTLFEAFIKNKIPVQKLTYDSTTKKLLYGVKGCEDKFTYQEFKLLGHFVTHENELVTRDQVGEVMWGKFFHEKYSDWSIDKTISTIRKKLDALGFPSHFLVTLKKRGFSFSNP